MSAFGQLRGLSPVSQQYIRVLQSIWENPLRINDPSFAEQKEPEVWSRIRRDTKIAQAIRQRCAAIVGTSWQIQAGGDSKVDLMLAKIVEDALRRIRRFLSARKRLCHAIFRGRAYERIYGHRAMASLAGGPIVSWWIPRVLRSIDKWRFEIVPERNRSTRKLQAMRRYWSVDKENWINLNDNLERLFVEVVYDDEEQQLGYGRGLLDSIYFMWWVKMIVLKEGLQGLERWAQGIAIGRVREGGGGSATDPETRRARLEDQFGKHRSQHFLSLGPDDEIEVLTGGAEGHQMVIDFLKYCDDSSIGLIMGSILPFGQAEGVGSLARAEVESESTDQVIQFDREEQDEAITEKLIGLFLYSNRPQIAALGLSAAKPPKFETVQQRHEDFHKNAQVVAILRSAGIPLRKDEVYKKVGFTQPSEGDEIFEGIVAPGDGIESLIPEFPRP